MPSSKTEDGAKVRDGEYAAKLTSDISGGIGNHKSGTKLRNLSSPAFNTLIQSGLATGLKAGADVSDAVDASAPIVPSSAPPEAAEMGNK
jgi:hypothetical protein